MRKEVLNVATHTVFGMQCHIHYLSGCAEPELVGLLQLLGH